MEKPFSQASENNKQPILQVVEPYLMRVKDVLEIGSGTGQHAVYLAAALSHLQWQTSDLGANHEGINMWLAEAGLKNVLAPLELDAAAELWPKLKAGAVFTANTVHYMPWAHACELFKKVATVLQSSAPFLLYGPFNYDGRFISDGNERLDAWLKNIDPQFGIRDFEVVVERVEKAGFVLDEEHIMPANNRLLAFLRA
ncbi:MAG: DUF938 domain-containing protein [Pseudomonadota bacterium]